MPSHFNGSIFGGRPSNGKDIMKLELIFALTLAFVAHAVGQPVAEPPADYETNKTAAEQFYADGSYARAHDIYAKVDVAKLPGDEARWVAFRTADGHGLREPSAATVVRDPQNPGRSLSAGKR